MSESTSPAVDVRQASPEAMRRLLERCRAIERELVESTARADALQAELDAIREALMKAGPVGTLRESLGEDKHIVALGRTNVVVSALDADFAAEPGDLVQTDSSRALALQNLGSGHRLASDTAEYMGRGGDGRLTVKAQGELKVCDPVGELRNGGAGALQPGDILICDLDGGLVFGVLSRSETKSYTENLRQLVYAGSRDVLGRIESLLVDPLFKDASKRTPGMLVILTGPAGSGKSHAAKAICQRRDVYLARFTASDVSSPFVAETGRNIEAIFSQAIAEARNGRRVVILAEEVDSVASRRTGFATRCAASQEFANITSTIITQLDRLVDLGPDLPVAVAFTTNLLREQLDPAVRSRAAAEILVGYIDREYGQELLAAHLSAGSVELAGGRNDQDRLIDILFDGATPLVTVDAQIGQTRERFRLSPTHMMVPRLIAGLAEDLKRLDSPVPWNLAAREVHARILAHACQIADSPAAYVPHADHPFAGDPDLQIAQATAVYPHEPPREFLQTNEGR